jgi:hypothetical protein
VIGPQVRQIVGIYVGLPFAPFSPRLAHTGDQNVEPKQSEVELKSGIIGLPSPVLTQEELAQLVGLILYNESWMNWTVSCVIVNVEG